MVDHCVPIRIITLNNDFLLTYCFFLEGCSHVSLVSSLGYNRMISKVNYSNGEDN